jgi:DNA-binding SARP family transcriptional activator/Flp pilus assembly protein TadD
MLVLDILGTLSLRDDAGTVPVAAQQKRRLGLLAVLALAGKQGLSRERVEAYLWPESSAALARHALDQTIYAIRNALGGEVILSTGRELRLNSEMVSADVWKFEDAILVAEWEQAVEHYKGPLLEGTSLADNRDLESWVDSNRARLRRAYENAIELLANRSAEMGDHSASANWWRMLATSDPLSPRVTKQLMLALANAGDRAGAVKHARLYQALVRQELEMEPDAEIEDLVSTFRQTATAGTEGTLAAAGGSIVTPSAVVAPTAIVTENPLGETRLARLSTRDALRTMHSPMAAILSFSALTALLIGAVLMDKRKAESPESRPVQPVAMRAQRTPVPAARSSYLRGLAAWNEGSKQGVDTAVVYFRRATELDPDYAQAYAALSSAYAGLGYYGYRPSEAMFPKAKGAALRAIQLDSTLGPAHAALAFELISERDFEGAESESRIAISLQPTYALAHQGYAHLLMILGRKSEALSESRTAATLDPFSLIIQGMYGRFLNSSGEHKAALRQLQKSVAEEPDTGWVSRNPWPSDNLARVYADNGRYTEAIQTIERALKIIPHHPRVVYSLALIYDMTGRRDMARQAFARADTSNEYYAAYRGMLYAEENNADSAFLWFNRVEHWGIMSLEALQSDRHLDSIRGDSRYCELLHRIGIPNCDVTLHRDDR